MLRHVVMFRWTSDSTETQRAELRAALEELPAMIPTIRSYHVGPDVGINAGNFEFAVVADFDDVEGYLEYRDHRAHQRVIAEHISPVMEQRAAVQYECAD